MLQTACQKFSGGCMMLMRREGETVTYLGTAFLVHQEGYLLSVAHILPREAELMAVPNDQGAGFLPVTQDRVAPWPVRVVRTDLERDLALLKLDHELDLRLPDHFLGSAENIYPGSPVLALGFAFGHQQIHTLLAMNGVISAKVVSRNQTRLLLFDATVHDGDRGGPLVSAEEGMVVGVINGRFDPSEASKEYTDGSRTLTSAANVSYAVAIEYGLELLEAAGLTVR